MVQSIDNNINRQNYNAVKINIQKPQMNGNPSVDAVQNDNNGNYSAVSINIDNPTVNMPEHKIYDYPEAQAPVTYDMANINQIPLPQGFHVAYQTTNLILPKMENELEVKADDTKAKAPEEDVHLSIDWEKGVPVALNGEKMSQREILEKLNEIGGQHGIGIIDIVENRVVGMKSRGVYETPGGTILMEAHQQLEELILDRETLKYKRLVSVEFAELVYAAKWFSPLREALTAFVDKTQEYVTGTTNFRLYKGNIIKEGTTSPYSLYDEDIASFKTGDLYDHHDAEGFITLYGLSTKVRAMKLNNKK